MKLVIFYWPRQKKIVVVFLLECKFAFLSEEHLAVFIGSLENVHTFYSMIFRAILRNETQKTLNDSWMRVNCRIIQNDNILK